MVWRSAVIALFLGATSAMRIQTLDVQDGVQPVIAGPGFAPIKANVYGIANECTEGIPDNRDKG